MRRGRAVYVCVCVYLERATSICCLFFCFASTMMLLLLLLLFQLLCGVWRSELIPREGRSSWRSVLEVLNSTYSLHTYRTHRTHRIHIACTSHVLIALPANCCALWLQQQNRPRLFIDLAMN